MKNKALEEWLKLVAKIRRLQYLNQPFNRGGKHKNKKKDRKRDNTVRDFDDHL